MRAVNGNLGHSFRKRYEELENTRLTRAIEDRAGYP